MHLPHIFHLPPLPPELDWLPPLLGIAALLLLLRMAVRGACRLCLLVILTVSLTVEERRLVKGYLHLSKRRPAHDDLSD